MITTFTQARQELEDWIGEEAGRNPAFRRCLLDDPKGVIADFLGAALPPGMNIAVLEETPGHHYLVLPPTPPDLDALPLDDLELALVGGGHTLRPTASQCKMSNTRASAPHARNSQRSSY